MQRVPVDRRTFSSVMGAFPTGVVIVATVDRDGSPHGLTTQNYISLSTQPPLLLLSIATTAPILAALRETGAFVVNFIVSGREELATRFATEAEGKFASVRWRPSSIAKGSPILDEDSVAFAECILTRTTEAGDHSIVIGSVEDATVSGGTPLMQYRRAYASWPGETPARPSR
jgi:flavin reductase (DIM6/NTAB) family NADH-FMN oxidoreductase RutF